MRMRSSILLLTVCLVGIAASGIAGLIPPGTALQDVRPVAAVEPRRVEPAAGQAEVMDGWLLLTPPVKQYGYREYAVLADRPLSEWTVQRTLQSEEECERTRRIIIGELAKQRQGTLPAPPSGGGGVEPDFGTGLRSPVALTLFAKSRCVHSEALKTDEPRGGPDPRNR